MGKAVVIGALALALVAAGWFSSIYLSPARAKPTDHAHVAVTRPSGPRLAYVDVKEVTLRLADSDTEHYIKITPVIAVLSGKADEMENDLPIVRDRIVSVVSARFSNELVTQQGQTKLKKDLLDSLHKDFPADIVNIYFNSYLVE